MFSEVPKLRPLRTFFSLGKMKNSQWLRWKIQVKMAAGEPQECFLRINILLWRGQFDMERCHDGTSICLQCLVSRGWLLFWAFQGHRYKKNLVDSLSWTNKFFWTIPLLSKRQNSLDLIFDLLIQAFFGLGEFAVFHFFLCLLVTESYSKIHALSPVTLIISDSITKIKTLIFSNVLLVNCEVIGHYFRTDLPHV